MKQTAGRTLDRRRDGCDDGPRMRFGIVCAAWLCWASVAVAQVSFVRNEPKDAQVAAALEQLIGEPVIVVDAAVGGGESPRRGPSDARVSIDRRRAALHVVTDDRPAGLTRVLDDQLLAKSPYAVALVAAELLDLLHVVPARGSRATSALTEVKTVVETRTSVDDDSRANREPSLIVAPTRTIADEPTEEEDDSRPDREAPPPPPPPAEARDVTETREASARTELVDSVDASSVPAVHADARSPGGGSPQDYAFGADLELQSQPGHELSFVRPAVYGELSWGRETAGPFWTAGARVSAPFGRELQPSATGPAEDSRVRAQAMDAALQVGAGYSLGRLGVAAHLAAGMTYLRVEALDAARHALGHDAQFSPLLGAGLGARFSIALGFALAVRGEAQWAGPPTEYRIGGVQVLEGGAFRVGLLAGVLWESAFGRAVP
jgi:hypothetical protein